MRTFNKLTHSYRLVQSAEEVISFFVEHNSYQAQIWSSSNKQQSRCQLVRVGDKFAIQVDLSFKPEGMFYIHCSEMTFALKLKAQSESIEKEGKIISATLIKWVRPEYRGMIRNKVAKTRAFLHFETATEKKVISGEVKNFNFYGCQIQFQAQYEDSLRKMDPKNIPINIKSANELTYYGNLCYISKEKDIILVGIHFPDGCTAKVQFDNWS